MYSGTTIFKMADRVGEGRVTYLPAIKGNRTKVYKKKKDLIMKAFNPMFPNIDSAKKDVHNFSTIVANKQMRKQISEWFRSWRPWQKRILLCNMTEICSKEQLKALITILEPVFHRDFAARFRGMYPVLQTRIVHRQPNYALVTEKQNDKSELNKLEDSFRECEKSEEINYELEEENAAKITENFDGEKQEILQETQSGPQKQRHFLPSLSSGEKTIPQVFSGAKAVEIPSTRRHEHAPQFCKTVSISNFFDPNVADELSRLGDMRTKYRCGDMSQVYGYAPITFKHAKWWEYSRERKLVKPRRSKLSKYFKSQLNQIEKVIVAAMLCLHGRERLKEAGEWYFAI